MDDSAAAGGRQSHNSPSRDQENERSVEEEGEYNTRSTGGRSYGSQSTAQQLSSNLPLQNHPGIPRVSSQITPQSTSNPGTFQQSAGPPSNPYDVLHSNPSSQTPFNMSAMVGVLPEQSAMNRHSVEQQQNPRYQVGHTSPAHMYQMQQHQPQQQPQQQQISPSFAANQMHQGFQQNPLYPYQHLTTTPHVYPSMIAPQQGYTGGPSPPPTGYNASWMPSPQGPYMYYPQNPAQVDYQGQHGGFGINIAGTQTHGRRGGQGMEGHALDFPGTGVAQPGYGSGLSSRSLPSKPAGAGTSGVPSRSLQLSIPRGPPRKPKQSGNALWVGNLPPATNIVDLKDHFSKDATHDIESVFLISKSNCAFVNYRTDTSCAAAMNRFHDSKFHGVRLVCRLRRTAASPSTGAASSSSTGPSDSLATPPAPQKHSSAPNVVETEGVSIKPEENETPESLERSEKPSDRYFVVKSLTVEDLELSVRNGIWATQAHNESTLNKAFAESENVYLIFSANKSGEYFGYARMTSAIEDDPSMQNEWTPQKFSPEAADLPKAISTQATATAPKGRIIDDSSRGTIFWEAENDLESDGELDKEQHEATAKQEEVENQEESTTFEKAWGKPFRIEWLSTNRLPFFRTRGLRNSWNANREVKIARDGTELETSVGRRLLEIFHRPNQQHTTASTQPLNRASLSPHVSQ